MRPRLLHLLVTSSLVSAAAQGTISCEEYEAPPTVRFVGAKEGVRENPLAPIVLDFGTPIESDTLRVSVVESARDVEKRLADEDDDPDTSLTVYLSHEPGEEDLNATTELDATERFLTLTPKAPLPIGSDLVLLVESGIRSKSGRTASYRQELDLSYAVRCSDAESKNLASGTYFMMLSVEEPIGAQLQLFAKIDVVGTKGRLNAQFTRATRDLEQTCPMPCKPEDACRLLPTPECVPRSTAPASVEEYPDFVPNTDPENGFSVHIQGCAVDDGAASNVGTAATAFKVKGIGIAGLTLNAKFATDDAGVVQGAGGLTAGAVSIGSSRPQPGRGTLLALRIPDDRVPPGIPDPPPYIPDTSNRAEGDVDASR